MKKTAIFLILFAAFAQIAIGQKNQKDKKGKKDFIITLSQDTIWGKIIGNMTPAITSTQIGFVDDKTQTKTVHKAGEIESWHPGGVDFYFESKVYKPKNLPKDEHGFSVFMKRRTMYDGTVKMYEYYNTDGQEGYTQVFLQKSGKLREVNYDKFYAELAEFFADYVDLANKIKEKKFKKSELSKIVDEYNLWKNKKV